MCRIVFITHSLEISTLRCISHTICKNVFHSRDLLTTQSKEYFSSGWFDDAQSWWISCSNRLRRNCNEIYKCSAKAKIAKNGFSSSSENYIAGGARNDFVAVQWYSMCWLLWLRGIHAFIRDSLKKQKRKFDNISRHSSKGSGHIYFTVWGVHFE